MRRISRPITIPRAGAAVALLTVGWAGATQFEKPTRTYEELYGKGEPVELDQIEHWAGPKTAVRTRGRLTRTALGTHYFELTETGFKVLVIPVPELEEAVGSLAVRHVEVVGLVRRLVEHQGACKLSYGRSIPQSQCDDPYLPVTPDLDTPERRDTWPRISITIWSIDDMTRSESRRSSDERLLLADLLAPETAPSEKPVRVIGRFCGANLCGGLAGPPDPSAWVLQDQDAAVWVIGKEPKGRGWRLDPTYKGDTSRFLEVTGRVVPCGTARCLRAQALALVPRPDASSSP